MMIANDDEAMGNEEEGREEGRERGMTTQCKEDRNEDLHKFSRANDDMDITHLLQSLTLNSSFLSL